MEIEELLSNNQLRLKKAEIANIIGVDDESVEKLIALSFSRKMPLCWRAAWILDHMAELDPHLLTGRINKIWTTLFKNHPDGVTRSLLRMLTRYEIPNEYIGQSADICLEWIEKKSVPVAIKVYAMEILVKIAQIYPELSSEFSTIISDQTLINSIGYKARAKKVLKKLHVIGNKVE